MPSPVPYDYPSLALGHLVDERVLAALNQINVLQTKTDAALDKLNSLIALRRGLSMTINEMTALGVDTGELSAEIEVLNGSIAEAARAYMKTRIANDTAIQKGREEVSELVPSAVSTTPVNLTASTVQSLPLSYDSVKVDVQYFSYVGADSSTISDVEHAIRESQANLGGKAPEIAKAAGNQIGMQRKNHNVSGTLIISATSTHRSSAILEPIVIDVDKALSIWNTSPGGTHTFLDEMNPKAMATVAQTAAKAGDDALSILTGVNYGSSFVGMVHFVNNQNAMTNPSEKELSALQERLRLGGWLENASGGMGIDPSVTEEIKRFVNSQNVTSHVNLIVNGVLPKLGANNLKSGVALMLESEVETIAETIGSLEALTHSDRDTVETGSRQSQTAHRMAHIRAATLRELATSLSSIDVASNKVLDTNSLMTAFENYLIEIKDSQAAGGIPVSFFLTRLSASDIARQWLKKYYSREEKTEDAASSSS